MFKKIFGIFTQRWFLVLLGVLAVALIIWYAGPLFAFAEHRPLESPWSRQLAIGILVGIWLLNELRKFVLGQQNNRQMLAELLKPSPSESRLSPEEERELATLTERMEGAVGVLKKMRFRGSQGRQFIYQLPWYMIIGPPGAGKTTALVYSGLNFPLEDHFGSDDKFKNKLKGVGGTRNCDWWFTDEAVLVDTAGRYTTHDSNQQADRTAWTGFLDLLKKHRRRRPISGAIVAISVLDLITLSDDERQDHVRAIRNRIQELHDRLSVRFPVYVLFTKCDLLAGFSEFFADLRKDERAQVWGMTFPIEAVDTNEGAVGGFSTEFAELEQRLNTWVVERLQQEQNPEHRDLIYGFPKQFSTIRERAEEFLYGVFKPSRFLEKPLLRGVYFSSGTQEGAPIDRLMGALAPTFGLQRENLPGFSGTGRSYFITDLFRNVIFAESGLAGTDLKLEWRRAWLQRGAYAIVLALVGLGFVFWSTAYTQNRAYVKVVAQRVEIAHEVIKNNPKGDPDLLGTLRPLDAVRSVPEGYGDEGVQRPWLRPGLYQGEKLGSAATRSYDRLLKNLYYPQLMFRLEQRLGESNLAAEDLYNTLRVYLMLSNPKERLDEDAVKQWFVEDWQENSSRTVPKDDLARLHVHLSTLLDKKPSQAPLNQHEELVKQARATLSRVPLAQRLYKKLKRDGLGRKLPVFRVSDKAGKKAGDVFQLRDNRLLTSGLPGRYSYKGYYQEFIPKLELEIVRLSDENWVLGEEQLSGKPAAAHELFTEVEEIYLREFADEWQKLMNSLAVVNFESIPQAVGVTRILAGASGRPSPVLRLLIAIDEQTGLDRSPIKIPTVVEKAGKKVEDIKSTLFGGDGEASEEKIESNNLVARRFRELHELVRPEVEGAPPPIVDVLSLVREVHIHMAAVETHEREGELLRVAKGRAVNAIDVLEREAPNFPEPVRGWFEQVAVQSRGLIGKRTGKILDDVLRDRILVFCDKNLRGLYPLETRSNRDVSLKDFGKFFGHGGLMDSFFTEHLKRFVDVTRRPWRPLQSNEVEVSRTTLRAFERAAVIREAFFSDGGREPRIEFEVKPMKMDGAIKLFVLDVGDQRVKYQHGPTKRSLLQWPTQGAQQVRVQVSPQIEGQRSVLSAEGDWALFRILQQSGIARVQSSSQKYIVTFNVDGRDVQYELNARSALNPFKLKELQAFRCPRGL